MSDVIEVGSRIGMADLQYLPPTSRVRRTGGNQFIRKLNGKWMQVGYPHNNWEPIQVTPDWADVEFIPEPVVVPGSKSETFESWQRKFLAAVRSGANNHGVREHTINEAFDRIGVDRSIRTDDGGHPVFEPGDVGRGRNALRYAPEGTLLVMDSGPVIQKWTDPYWRQMAPTFNSAAMNVNEEGWTLIRWGHGNLLPMDFRPVEEEVEVSEEDRTRLVRAKQAAWRVGMQMKTAHSWCSALETILADGGVTARDANGGSLDVVTQASRDVGTLFLYQSQSNPTTWALLRRANGMRNAAGTVRVAGNYTRNTAERVYQVHRPGREWEGADFFTVNRSAFLETLHDYPGLTFQVDDSYYRVATDAGQHRWIDNIARQGRNRTSAAPRADVRNSYSPADFGVSGGSVTLLYVPGLFE